MAPQLRPADRACASCGGSIEVIHISHRRRTATFCEACDLVSIVIAPRLDAPELLDSDLADRWSARRDLA
jgi:hypothetical protein